MARNDLWPTRDDPGAMLNEDECWARFQARDRSAEGAFVAGVLTTGIFCRPACPARTPLRRNVRFWPCAAEAMAVGFRPCRRCHPLHAVADVGLATVTALVRVIEEQPGETLDLATLAKRAGYSPAHCQRRFTAIAGLSPRAYHSAIRARVYRLALREEPTATAALHRAGYASTSRVAGTDGPLGGMTPTQYRRGGAAMRLDWITMETIYGPLTLAASERGLAFACFGAHAADELRAEFPHAELVLARPDMGGVADWGTALADHLAGRRPDPRLPLDIQGTAFQRLVWEYLTTIPRGETRTYTQVAAAVSKPTAVRAAASACGANNVSFLIPCHRVIRNDGGLGGYRGGIEVKRRLLADETAALF